MGFNITDPYMDCATHKSPSVTSVGNALSYNVLYIMQILSFEFTSSSPIFKDFCQVNFRMSQDEIVLDFKISGVHGNSHGNENWEEVVVVEQHGILIGCYRAFS